MRMSKFSIVGVVSTLVMYGFYLLILHFSNYIIAYTISYCIGIVVSMLLNLRYVFKVHYTLRTSLIYTFIYLSQYMIGLTLVHFFIVYFAFSPKYAPIVAILFTAPYAYILIKMWIGQDGI